MKTVKFYKDGNTVRIFDYDDQQVTDKLVPAVYSIDQDLSGFYLTFVTDRFTIPEKIYGSTKSRAQKILDTYDDRHSSTGVLLTGDKGSGKTLLTSILGNHMLERGLPVIMIEKPFSGTAFNDLLNNIGESMLMFDEFGKVFNSKKDDDDNENQNSLLSVFDGARSIKRLILLTENDTFKVNSYMLNRPGRVFYHFKYDKLGEDIVREYCDIQKVPEDVIQAILLRVESSYEFSFDALKAVVEEYLRFKEDITEVFKNLNIEEGKVREDKMKVARIINMEDGKTLEHVTEEVSYPISSYGDRIYYKTGHKHEDGRDITNSVEIEPEDLVERTASRHIYNIEDKKLVVILDKMPAREAMGFSKFLDY